jgi:hypothetical protein
MIQNFKTFIVRILFMQNYNLTIVHAEAGVSSEDSLWVHLKMLQSNVSSALCSAASIRDRLESLQRNGTLINKSVVEVERVNLNVVESVGESSSSVAGVVVKVKEEELIDDVEIEPEGPFFAIEEDADAAPDEGCGSDYAAESSPEEPEEEDDDSDYGAPSTRTRSKSNKSKMEIFVEYSRNFFLSFFRRSEATLSKSN